MYGGLYTPQVNPYGIHGFHPPIPWIPYGMVLGEVPAIFWVHGHLGFHMEWSWNGHGMINSIWNVGLFHME
jgi:hypothetical protein